MSDEPYFYVHYREKARTRRDIYICSVLTFTWHELEFSLSCGRQGNENFSLKENTNNLFKFPFRKYYVKQPQSLLFGEIRLALQENQLKKEWMFAYRVEIWECTSLPAVCVM